MNRRLVRKSWGKGIGDQSHKEKKMGIGQIGDLKLKGMKKMGV